MSVVKQMYLEEIAYSRQVFEAIMELDLWVTTLKEAKTAEEVWHAYVCILTRMEILKLAAKSLAELIASRPIIAEID